MSHVGPGDVLRVPLSDGRQAMAQVVDATATAVALTVGDAVWDCDPGPLDWDQCGRAIVHIVLRPAGLSGAVVVGHAAVDADATAAHAIWAGSPSRPVSPAPLAVLMGALLGG